MLSNLITNGSHSNNTDIIIKGKKMNEFEYIKSKKNFGKSIQSLYILKDIFSFLSEEQKLKIIIYNKQLQNKLDINIVHYKKKEEYIEKVKEMEKEKNIIKMVN